jgi:transcriptional repressor NF-X1
MPSTLTHCPCGKTLTRELLLKNKIIRTSCKDPIPTCDKTCGKLLKCPHNINEKTTRDFHMCESKCHLGECGRCEKEIEVLCRCGKETETVKCYQSDEVKLCKRRCQKKKSCSKHQCAEICCNDKDHICMQVCNKLLACGLHRCEDLCHKGNCKRCLVASFEERICECGATIQYPPIRCGIDSNFYFFII